MKRKLVQQGASTMMVSLPSKWIKSHKLKKGDEIELNEKEGNLVIGSDIKEEERRILLDISNLSPLHQRILAALYMSGYDEVELKYTDPKMIQTIQKEVMNDLIGFEIVEQTKNFCRIKEISETSQEEFENLLRRIFLLIKSMVDETVEAMNKKETNLEHVQVIDNNINKLVFFCLRTIKKKGYKESNKTLAIYTIILSLEELADMLKGLARHITQRKLVPKKEIAEFMQSIQKFYNQYYELFYSPSKEKAVELAKQYNSIIAKMDALTEKTTDIKQLRLAYYLEDIAYAILKLMGYQLTILL